MDATRFSHEVESAAEGLAEHPKALGTGDRYARITGGVVGIALNPERRSGRGTAGKQTVRLGQSSNDHQQGADAAALLKEGVCGNSGRHLVARESAAHCDNRDGREAPADYGEKLEAGHPGHIEIGQNDIRNLLLHFGQRGKSVFRGLNGVANLSKYLRQRDANYGLIVNDKQGNRGGLTSIFEHLAPHKEHSSSR